MGIASDTMADLYRKDWEDYKKRFFPQEQELIDFATSDVPIQEALERGRENVDMGFENAATALDQSLAGYGVNQTARQREAQQRKMAIDKSATLTDTLNKSRFHVQDQQKNVMAGGMAVGTNEGRLPL